MSKDNVIPMHRSYKVGVKTKEDPDWVYNSLRFITKDDAFEYAERLVGRWTAVIAYVITPSDEAANQPPFPKA